jgi:hypothetical protein
MHMNRDEPLSPWSSKSCRGVSHASLCALQVSLDHTPLFTNAHQKLVCQAKLIQGERHF